MLVNDFDPPDIAKLLRKRHSYVGYAEENPWVVRALGEAHDLPGSQVRRPIRLTGFTKNRAGVLVNTLDVEFPNHLTTLKMLIVIGSCHHQIGFQDCFDSDRGRCCLII